MSHKTPIAVAHSDGIGSEIIDASLDTLLEPGRSGNIGAAASTFNVINQSAPRTLEDSVHSYDIAQIAGFYQNLASADTTS